MAHAKRPSVDAMTAGWLVFGNLVVDRFDAGRAGTESRLGRWLTKRRTKASAEVAPRSVDQLTADELRELGIRPAVGGPAFTANALTGLTLLSLAGR